MLDVSLPVYHELSLEFLSSYVFDASRDIGDSHTVLFTLGGREFNLSVNTLNVLLGFETDESLHDALYESAYREVPSTFAAHLTEKWRELSIESAFMPHSSRSVNIRDDGLRLCHRFLSYNMFGRSKMMNIVTAQELFILDCMRLHEKLNFGLPVSGSFITLLAQRLHVYIPEPIYVHASSFTLNDFRTMHLLFVNAERQYQLSRPGVSGPSHSPSAGTSSGTAPTLAAIEELFERFTHRLESCLDALEDRLMAVEQAVINFSRSP
ncbi:hypothetical protein C2S52_006641 [Perilla frutescens var. hirtella]|nr:hypothetical protein C2S52_006641 [Perilla frutescens var. hirtella]